MISGEIPHPASEKPMGIPTTSEKVGLDSVLNLDPPVGATSKVTN
jgi:hypothetical protein